MTIAMHILSGIDDDLIDVLHYLLNLDEDELETLGQLLGLSYATITDYKDTNRKKYCRSILKAWLLKQDRVVEKGGPHWSTLERALRDPLLGQNGIADKIRQERLS